MSDASGDALAGAAAAGAADTKARRAALASPAWTPGRRDFAWLVELLGGDDKKLQGRAEAALVRAAAAARDWLLDRLPALTPPARGRVVRALARFHHLPGGERLRAALEAAISDGDPRTRRAAIGALGRYPGQPTEAQLLAAWQREDQPSVRRAIAEALGKVGGAPSRALLASLHTDDAELARLRDQALLRLRRAPDPGSIAQVLGARAPAQPLAVRLRCRAGIEGILVEECPPSWKPRVVAPGLVDVVLSGPLDSLFAVRTAIGFGLLVPWAPAPAGRSAGSVEALAELLTGDPVATVLAHFTDGPIRFRLELPGGGKQRAAVHRLAEAIAVRRPAWVNDPSRRCWEVVVPSAGGEAGAGVHGVELRPHLPDPRFAHRQAQVPASSHPTLAAALAWVAGVDPHDVVWDPFVGAAAELIERARLGPYRRLHGGDIDDRALAAARANLGAAELTGVELVRQSALEWAPAGVTLILTNPPMGRRVHRAADLSNLLERFVAHAARSLSPGGRLVWFSPHGAATAAAAQAAGLTVDLRSPVDLGGFAVELQRLRRPAPSRAQRPL